VSARTLHVRCSTWEQVEVFTTRKLRKGKLLSMKVPFAAQKGGTVTIGLELPNEVVIAIDGVIQKAAPVEVDGKLDANRTWIEIELHGFTEEVRARLKAFQQEPEPVTDPNIHIQVQPPAPERKVDKPAPEELPGDERALFQHLSNELRRMRSAAVHDVLGVPEDAGPELVRTCWKDLVRRHHPDLVARRNAPAITHLAEELTILANRAYDRLRVALAIEGRGAIVGPSVASPPGWLVAFEDLQSDVGGTAAPRRAPGRFETTPGTGATEKPPRAPSPAVLVTEQRPPTPASTGGSDAFELRARAMLGQGDSNTAREVLAAALVVYPRSKPLRSLYYVATALAALEAGELQLATAQLETALAHHEQCTEAAKMLEHIRRHGTAATSVVRGLFQ
jgi:hypothetical protein